MEKRLNKKIEVYITTFKDDIKELITEANNPEQINEVDDSSAQDVIFEAIIDSLEKQEEDKDNTKNNKVLALLNKVNNDMKKNTADIVSKGGNNNSKSKKNKKSNKNKTKKRKGKSSSSRKLKFAKVKKV